MLKILKIFGFITLVLFASSFLLQSCLTFRTPDKEVVKNFKNKGLTLETKYLIIKAVDIQTLKENESHFHYAKIGFDSLPTILFIHGSPGSWRDFSEYMQDQDLLSKYRIVSVDRPGFGYSDFGTALNLQDQGNSIGLLINKLRNNKPLYLVGHSLGGPLVALLAADNPKDVSGILILAGALDPDLEPKEKWRPIIGSFPIRYLVPGAFRPSNQELWYLQKDLHPLKEKLKLVKSKVYIMHGDKDMLVDVKNMDYMKSQFINAKSLSDTIFLDENHFLPWTRFREIKDMLMKIDN